MLATLHQSNAAELVFRVGASVGRDGVCAPLYEQTSRGYQYFFDWFARQKPQVVTDTTGRNFSIRLEFSLASHNCTEAGRAEALASLIYGRDPNPSGGDPGQLPVHILLGGNGENAQEDAIQADRSSRLLLHCCTARDSVYTLDLPHVYGIFTPASMYTGAVLRAMAFSGIKRVAVVYTNDSALHVQLCQGALRQLPNLVELRPGFGSVINISYTAAEASRPDFWQTTADQIAAERPDALVACDEMSRTSQLVRRLREGGVWLSALWLASYGNVLDFMSYLEGAGEYALTTVQWMPSLPYADPAFGTAADYAADFTADTGLEASYFSAAATATGYVVATVLQQVIGSCDLSGLADGGEGVIDADSFMWGPMSCAGTSRGVQYDNVTGQMMVGYVLDQLHMETFYGPVGFNNYRQNVYHPPVVAQVLNDRLTVVVPLDLAEQRLVMPIPRPLPARPGWATTTTGIVIISLLCCLGCLCLALLASLLHRWLRPRLSLAMEVEIDPAEVKVDVAPVRNMDGSFEPGEGMYRGTRVELVVATELLPPAALAPPALMPSPAPVLGQPPPLMWPPTPTPQLGSPASVSPLHVRVGQQARGSGNNQRTSSSSTLNRNREQISALVWRAVRLQHPRICPMLGIVWEWPGLLKGGGCVPVVVRQWYELGDLAQLLENETVPLPLLTKVNIAQGIAEGLAYLHAQEPAIIAGALELNRIVIDKHFNPHIFLRLQSLDANTNTLAAPAGALHGSTLQRTATRLVRAASGGLLRSVVNPATANVSASGSGGSSLPAVVPSAATLAATPVSGSKPGCAHGALRAFGLTNSSGQIAFAKNPIAAAGATSAAGVVHLTGLRSVPGNTSAQHVVLMDAASMEPADVNPVFEPEAIRSRALTEGLYVTPATQACGDGGGAGQVCSQAGDVYEFGRLLGSIFVATANRSCDSLLLKPRSADFGESTSHRVTPSGGAGAASAGCLNGGAGTPGSAPSTRRTSRSGSGSSRAVPGQGSKGSTDMAAAVTPTSVAMTPASATTTPTAASTAANLPVPVDNGVIAAALAAAVPVIVDVAPGDAAGRRTTLERRSWLSGEDEDDDNSLQPLPTEDSLMLAALEAVSPKLAELARNCMSPNPADRPSFAVIASVMEKRIKMALSEGLGLAGISRTKRIGFGSLPVGGATGAAVGAATGASAAGPHGGVVGGGVDISVGGGVGDGGGADAYNKLVDVAVAPFALNSTAKSTAAALVRVSEEGRRGSIDCGMERTTTSRGGGRLLLMTYATTQTGPASAVAAVGRVEMSRRSESFRVLGTGPLELSGIRRHHVTPDDLLFDIFPPKVANALLAGETVQPERYDCVSIFFSDVVGYTDLCAQLQPHEVMDLMHRLYSQFDALIQSMRLFKVETVGDAYLAVGNLRWPQPRSHARLAAQFALAAVRAANRLPVHPDRPELGCVRIRVGLHCGPVVGSVVGTLNRRYCLFGDAVNTAARMEHNSEADRVHCSGAFASLVADQWADVALTSRGVRPIKGKGPMETFWLEAPDTLYNSCTLGTEAMEYGTTRVSVTPGDRRLSYGTEDGRTVRTSDKAPRLAVDVSAVV